MTLPRILMLDAAGWKARLSYGHVIAFAAFVIMTIGMGGYSIFGVFLEPILSEFGWTRATVSGAYSLSMVLSGVLSIAAGRLTDRFGPRLLLIACGIFIGASYILTSRLHFLWQIYLFYGLLMGIGIGTMIVPLMATVARWFEKKRSTVVGLVMSGTGLGTIVLPLWADSLIRSHGWRTALLAMGITSVVLVTLCALAFRGRGQRSQAAAPTDKPVVVHVSQGDRLSYRRAIADRRLQMLWVIFFGVGFATFGIVVHIVIHATGIGFSTSNAINALAIIGVLSIAGRIGVGVIGDALGNRSALIISLSVMLFALVWLEFATELWALYVFAVFFGFAWGGLFVLPSPMLADSFGLKYLGMLFGIVQLGLTVGATSGPVILGYIFDKVRSYEPGFLMAITIIVVSMALAFLLGPPRGEKAFSEG